MAVLPGLEAQVTVSMRRVRTFLVPAPFRMIPASGWACEHAIALSYLMEGCGIEEKRGVYIYRVASAMTGSMLANSSVSN